MRTFKLILESFAFAWKALKSNLLRTVLSLLGVTVGIFAIIAVLTFVDSLERNIRESFDFLGADVIYLSKWPYGLGGGEYQWWDFIRRPQPSYNEYRFLEANMQHASAIAIYASRGNNVVKRGSNSIGQVNLTGGSYTYNDIFDLRINNGRYFTYDEAESGRNVAIIGAELVNALFPNGEDPIGKEIKISNLKYVVIGTLEREGQGLLNVSSNDYAAILPYDSFRKMFLTGTGRWNETGSTIGLKGHAQDVGLVELENELRGLMRVRRGLRPTESDNFAMNRPEAIAQAIGSVFDVLSVAGWIIGGFSILVGGFGIANIMFVSVRERTSIIGLQKSLGAKNFFVLFQFLFEAIFLSLIGGLAGLTLVYGLTFVPFGTLEVTMTIKNIVLGIGVSTVIGLVAGIVPAAVASRLDPVTALRSTG